MPLRYLTVATASSDAAEELVLAHGFDAGVASIADRAGIGKGAVYPEFAGKREILDALLPARHRRMNDHRVSRELGDRPRPQVRRAASARALSDDALTAFLDDRGILGEHVAEVTDGRYRDQRRQRGSMAPRGAGPGGDRGGA